MPDRLKASVPPEHISVTFGAKGKTNEVGISFSIQDRITLDRAHHIPVQQTPSPELLSATKHSHPPIAPIKSPTSGKRSSFKWVPRHSWRHRVSEPPAAAAAAVVDHPPEISITMGLQERSKWMPPRTPEILKVEVQGDDEDEETNKKKIVTVTVDRNEEEEKPYRGGFRDVRNGAQYLHAVAQTCVPWRQVAGLEPEPVPPETKTRETQASWMRNIPLQTMKEGFTQMDKAGCHICDCLDVTKVPRNYKDSEQWEEERIQAAITIQKYVRRSRCIRLAHQIREYAIKKQEFWAEQERIDKEKDDLRLRKERDLFVNPRTGEDFEFLYQQLEDWRMKEVMTIEMGGSEGMDRRKLVEKLLDRELKMLLSLDKLRCRAAKLNKADRITKSLTRMSKPKRWEMTNGSIMHVETQSTMRAADMLNLYKALKRKSSSMDERLGVLSYVKWTVQMFHTRLTQEILLLIEREADLMYRNRPASSLSGLRRRILDLFVQFAEAPEFNPEAAILVHRGLLDYDSGSGHSPMRKAALPP